MRISDEEVKKLLHSSGIAAEISAVVSEREAATESDDLLVREVTQAVIEMPDREETIADLRARIESGTYNPSGDEIAETMIRRAIADRIR